MRNIIGHIVLSIAALATQVTASESTVPLAAKVLKCDLVAIIKIIGVEYGHFHVPDIGQDDDQYLNVKLTASITKRIKGSSTDMIAIHAAAVRGMTAGFSDYGLKPGKSYIAYLQTTANGSYRLGWSSNQYLEGISDDGRSVNDIGQTLDQVPLAPKLWKLKALAAVGLPLALITDPVALVIALSLVLLIGVVVIRKKRINLRTQARLRDQEPN